MYCLTVLKFRSLKSRLLQGCFLPRAMRKGSASVLLPWLVCVHLFPYLFTLLSLYACLLLCQIFPFYEEPVIWIRAILVTSFSLDFTSVKTYHQVRSNSKVLWVRSSTYHFRRGIIQPIMVSHTHNHAATI